MSGTAKDCAAPSIRYREGLRGMICVLRGGAAVVTMVSAEQDDIISAFLENSGYV